MKIPPRNQPKLELFPSDLRALFRSLARWAVASSFGAAAGCAAVTTEMNGEPEPWEGFECSTTDGSLALSELNTPEPVAYVAAVQAVAVQGGTPEPTVYVRVAAGLGQACQGASDQQGCLDEVAALLEPPPPAQCPCPPSLIVTRDDEVFSVTSEQQVRSLLGAIDTRDEAILAAFLAGQYVECGYGEASSTEARAVGDGYEVATKWEACSDGLYSQNAEVDASGEVMVDEKVRTGDSGCAIGRRPEGLLCAVAPRAAGALGRYFASAAHLEAASVFAFDRLARELSALEAPIELVQRARRAALDEIRHARIVSRLAERFGGVAAAPSIARETPRTRFAVALENAIEGCVRETFGALVAWHQALAARDPVVREAMREIAEDETRHAELAWAIAAWLHPQLSAAEREQLAAARALAFAQLALDEVDLSANERTAIGWPAPEVCTALLQQLQPRLEQGVACTA
jgi:hypothetical protein